MILQRAQEEMKIYVHYDEEYWRKKSRIQLVYCRGKERKAYLDLGKCDDDVTIEQNQKL